MELPRPDILNPTGISDWFAQLGLAQAIGRLKPEIYLKRAREYFPEALCLKNVYGVMIVWKEGVPIIIAQARNALPQATPAQGEAFKVENFKKITQELGGGNQDIFSILKKMGPKQKITCQQLAKSGVAWCLHGMSYGKNEEARNKDKYSVCPNSVAGGCAERTLLYWLPYLVDLYQKVGPVFAEEVKFERKNPGEALVVWKNRKGGEEREERITNPTGVLKNINLTIITSFLPCEECAQAIVHFPIHTGQLVVDQFSRHKEGGQRVLDRDDLSALRTLIEGRVPIFRTSETAPPVLK